MKGSRFQKALSIAVALLLALAIVASYVMPEPEGQELPSVGSNRPQGRRALFLVLERLGWTPEAWRKPPGALPRGAHVLWCFDAPSKRERSDVPGAASPAHHGMHELEHYRAFVDAGGTLILEWNERTREFLTELDLEGIESFDVDDPSGEPAPRAVRTSDGSELSAPWRPGATLPQSLCDSFAFALWTSTELDRRPEVLAATIDVGAGSVVLLGDASFTANARLGDAQSAELALRLLDEQGATQRLFFDEYALGLWEPQTALGLAFSGARLWVTLHVFALLALLAWAAGWARAFPRDPPPLDAVSPISRARGLANVLARARRFGELARFARRGELERLRSRARLLRRRGEDGGREALERELELAAERLGARGDLARWRAAFGERRVSGEAELGSLLAELDALVAGVERAPARRARV